MVKGLTRQNTRILPLSSCKPDECPIRVLLHIFQQLQHSLGLYLGASIQTPWHISIRIGSCSMIRLDILGAADCAHTMQINHPPPPPPPPTRTWLAACMTGFDKAAAIYMALLFEAGRKPHYPLQSRCRRRGMAHCKDWFKLELVRAWVHRRMIEKDKPTRIVLCSFRRMISPSLIRRSAACKAASSSFFWASYSETFLACRSPVVCDMDSWACSCANSSWSSQLNSTWALFWDSSLALLAFSLSSVSTLFPVVSLYLKHLCRIRRLPAAFRTSKVKKSSQPGQSHSLSKMM